MNDYKKYRLFLLGKAFIYLIISLCLISFLYLPNNSDNMNSDKIFTAPGRQYLMGTDQFGRDILSRVAVSTRYVLFVGTASVILGALMGLLLGLFTISVNRHLQRNTIKVIDKFKFLTGALFVGILIARWGKGYWNEIMAISIFLTPIYAGAFYSLALEQHNYLYIKDAKSYGASKARILIRHILPNILPQIITQLCAGFTYAIFMESAVSFLGFGILPPNTSLGAMINEYRQYTFHHPYVILLPGIVLGISIVGFKLIEMGRSKGWKYIMDNETKK